MGIGMLFVVSLLTFSAVQVLPGNVATVVLGRNARPAEVKRLEHRIGLDKPFFVQFWHFLSNAAQGEFGLSLRQGAKAAEHLLAFGGLALLGAWGRADWFLAGLAVYQVAVFVLWLPRYGRAVWRQRRG